MKTKSIAEKSNIQIYAHNTKFTPVDGWTTTDKRGAIVLEDRKNKYLFCIQLGRQPKISVYNTKDNGNIIGDQLLNASVFSNMAKPWNKKKKSSKTKC